MKAVEFEGQTAILGPPRDMARGTCGALPVVVHHITDSVKTMSSFWKPSAEDLEKLNQGQYIRLDVYGSMHPPVWVSVDNITELP